VDGALQAIERGVALVSDLPGTERARLTASHGRALHLVGRYEQAKAVSSTALEEARSLGARSEEEAALGTLGVVLASLGDSQGGLGHLEAARRLAEERHSVTRLRPRPSRIGDMVREYADLASTLDRAGRSEAATAASREGSARARELGVATTWGQLLEANATLGLFRLGQWDEADRVSRELLDRGATGRAALRLHLTRARLETGRGNFAPAQTHLDAAGSLLPLPGDPDVVGELWTTAAEHAIWRGQLTEARVAIDAGLLGVQRTPDRLASCQLLAVGVRVEADRADRARAGRGNPELVEIRELATARMAELRAIVERSEGQGASAPRELHALPVTAEAEYSRIAERSDPGRWSAAAQAWLQLREPYPAAYARWREAEALLLDKRGREGAERALREARNICGELGAGPLLREIEALARRARMELDGAPAASATEAGHLATPEPARQATAEAQRLGLTTRELEVLALIAEGRTNREIGASLFITEKTAGHHVSNLLAKLGVRSRVEAAGVAHRLGLLGDPGA
jgi:DNA-binding CsgD family transcriptional regulator/tetratricopeptide (TPR) repeat protein